MNRKQFLLTLSVAIISGVLGGMLVVWFLMPPSVLAQGEPQKVIEAREFRVVDEDGGTLAILGQVGSFYKRTGLVLLGSSSLPSAEFVIGELGSPDLTMRKDGKTVVALSEFNGVGMLSLSELRGFSSHLLPGGLALHGPNLELMMSLSMEPEKGPSLILYDQDGNVRAALGTTELKNTRTGSTEIRAPSSLVLLDEDGKVVWSAP